MIRRPIALGVATAAFLAVAVPARAYVPEQTPRRAAELSARRAVADPAARGSVPGIVVQRGGVTVFGMNLKRRFLPASLMKIPTTTVAIRRFGPDHRFVTRVALDGQAPGRAGTLYMIGGGDPTLATEAYRRQRYEPKPWDAIKRSAFPSKSPTVEQLAQQVARAGIRVVRDIVVDESLFDSVRTQHGWLPTYVDRDPDTGLLSALTVNEGRLDPEGRVVAPSPAIAAGNFLARALRARDVVVTGSVRMGVTTADATEVAKVASPPLAEIVDFINRYSINFPAEMLLKNLGAAFGTTGSTAEGVKVVRATLASLGVPLDGFEMYDGSGLSRANRMTPATVAAILHRIVSGRDEGWEALRTSVPAAGEPGTLHLRMRQAPIAGNLHGKTGYLSGVRAMAGWVRASDGVPVVYVSVFNDAASAGALTRALDLFGTLLVRYPAV